MKQIAWMVMGVMVSLVTVGLGVANAEPNASAGSAIAVSAESDMTPDVEQSERSRQTTGTIVSVDHQAKTVTVKSRTGEKTFALSPRVRVKLGNLKATLADVQPGKKVFIRYRDVDGEALATTIKVL
jgi:Cu/Ag efflux protein CusF